MTSRQFACIGCRKYIDAGRYWSRTYLDNSEVVTLGRPVDIDRVLAVAEYWQAPAESDAAYDYLEWDDMHPGEPHDISMRTLREVKVCRTWADVEAFMRSRRLPVWWWGQPEIMTEAMRRFAGELR